MGYNTEICKAGSGYGIHIPIGIKNSPDGDVSLAIIARACIAGPGACELQRPIRIGKEVKTYLCGVPLNPTAKPEGGLEETIVKESPQTTSNL